MGFFGLNGLEKFDEGAFGEFSAFGAAELVGNAVGKDVKPVSGLVVEGLFGEVSVFGRSVNDGMSDGQFVGFVFEGMGISNEDDGTVGAGIDDLFFFGNDFTNGDFHSVLDLVLVVEALGKVVDDASVDFVDDFCGPGVGILSDNVVEERGAEDAHKGAGHAVARTIGAGQIKAFFLLGKPIKVAADDVFGGIKNERTGKGGIENFFGGHERKLYSPGVLDAVGDVFVVFFDDFFLFFDFARSLGDFFFEVLIKDGVVDGGGGLANEDVEEFDFHGVKSPGLFVVVEQEQG